MKKTALKVALVYDRVNSSGGAERVLQELHSLYPDAPLFTSVYESTRASWAHGWDIRTSFLQTIPWLRSRHQLLGWLMPVVFETRDLAEFELVISITSEFSKAVITSPNQLHVSYILTPTRYLWSHSDSAIVSLPFFLQPVAKKIFRVLRKYDYVVARRPDFLIAISRLVQERIKEFYNLSSHVLYPPFSVLPVARKPNSTPPFRSFVFAWGRLVPYKKFDLIIKASIAAEKPLVLLGDGPDKKRLQALARQLDPQERFVFFAPRCSDNELAWYLSQAKVAVFPQVEDFGIASLEAHLAGCSVITQRSSGASELMKEGVGTYFLDGEDDPHLATLIGRAWENSLERLDIQGQARQYAGARWRTQWAEYMDQLSSQNFRK